MIKAINRSIAARHEDNEKGFTLIELLVVILIIGVLAAIAIPAFLNQRESAWVSQVESDLRNATIAAESFAVAHNGSYSTLTVAELKTSGYNATSDVELWISGTPSTTFELKANHKSIDDATWTYSSSDGKIVKGTHTATPTPGG